MARRGIAFVVSGPSGAGKSTLLRSVLDADPRVRFSVSHTTRAPRRGEVNGTDYWFITPKEFQEMIDADAFLEWAPYNDHLYGTSRAALEEPRRAGLDIILEVEVQGAAVLRERLDAAVFVFIVPPVWEVLEERLRGRGTDPEEVIQKRLARAREELAHKDQYDHEVVNDDRHQAVSELLELIEEARRARG